MLCHMLLGNGQTVMSNLVETRLLALPAPLANEGSAG